MNIHLTTHCVREGMASRYWEPSVENYHHFILAFFVPLIKYRQQFNDTSKNKIYIRSFGNMDHMIKSLNYPDLIITNSTQHSLMKIFPENNNIQKYVDLVGNDYHTNYSKENFQVVSNIIQSEFASEISVEKEKILRKFTNEGVKTVLINRLAPTAFYKTNFSEHRTSGTDRRSIPNIGEIEHTLLSNGINLITESLEDASLWYAIALFQCADIIVAQHGAALSTLIFGRPSLKVIEIIPLITDPIREDPARGDHFRLLAKTLDQQYTTLTQESNHSAVNPTNILDKIKSIS